ncbi:hypothetical protein NP493_527g00032 [Ridgeia piscesae]|uniref:Uncharacterized protein n=1 Tax=Ridgeia piscesae TaxID=27915 RepID=A0AAD9KW56_RIDPI|nr:hypothetical protein NP493_527g00032 [Ridgeia piscesae]
MVGRARAYEVNTPENMADERVILTLAQTPIPRRHGTVNRDQSRRERRSVEQGDDALFVGRSVGRSYLAHLAVRYPGVYPTSPCQQLRVVDNPASGFTGAPATHRGANSRSLQHRYKSQSGTELEPTRLSQRHRHSRVRTNTTFAQRNPDNLSAITARPCR